jgi:lysophospholipase L1-like esterase
VNIDSTTPSTSIGHRDAMTEASLAQADPPSDWRATILAGLANYIDAGQHPSSFLAPGARYVAMGSSYAAGAGIGPLVPDSPKRCGRTQNNYAHLLAARRGLDLIDVSCGGATTAHILGPWSELPPQIDAVTPDTKLVTVTIGGNDVNYVRNLMTATCGRSPGTMPPMGRTCPSVVWPNESDYRALEKHLRQIAREVRQRAPQAMLVFVDYVRIVPDAGGCASVPLDATQLAAARETFRRMAEVTKAAASAEGAVLMPAGQLSKGHDACSSNSWGAGHPGNPMDWHPTVAGHEAIAQALAARLQ